MLREAYIRKRLGVEGILAVFFQTEFTALVHEPFVQALDDGSAFIDVFALGEFKNVCLQ